MGDVRFSKFGTIEASLPHPGRLLSEGAEASGTPSRSPCISLTLDRNGKLISISPSYEELTSYAINEVIGKHFYEMVSEEDAIGITLVINRLLAESNDQGAHWVHLLRKNDNPLSIVMNLMLVGDSNAVRKIGERAGLERHGRADDEFGQSHRDRDRSGRTDLFFLILRRAQDRIFSRGNAREEDHRAGYLRQQL
jgi:PAS domain-containing protein